MASSTVSEQRDRLTGTPPSACHGRSNDQRRCRRCEIPAGATASRLARAGGRRNSRPACTHRSPTSAKCASAATRPATYFSAPVACPAWTSRHPARGGRRGRSTGRVRRQLERQGLPQPGLRDHCTWDLDPQHALPATAPPAAAQSSTSAVNSIARSTDFVIDHARLQATVGPDDGQSRLGRVAVAGLRGPP